ncbi:MAG: hypothetical protein ABIR96_12390 [Bdellovibrionota bacterium]
MSTFLSKIQHTFPSVFFVIGLISSGVSHAQAVDSFSDQASYSQPLRGLTALPVAMVSEVNELTAFFKDGGFEPLNLQAGQGQDFFGVDQIFGRLSDGRFVYLMLNVKLEDPSNSSPLRKVDSGLVYHATTKAGLSYALHFEKFSATEVKQITDVLESDLNHESGISALSFPRIRNVFGISEAFAGPGDHATTTANGTTPVPAHRKMKRIIINNPNGKGGTITRLVPVDDRPFSEILSAVGTCGKNVGLGAVDATLGSVYRMVRTAVRVVVKPREVWHNAVGTFGKTREFFQELFTNKLVPKYSKKFMALSSAERARIICDFVGRVAGIAAVSYYAGEIGRSSVSDKVQDLAGDFGQYFTNVSDKLTKFVSNFVSARGRPF